MLNQRIEAARPIAKKINEVEKSLNLTMVQMGELLSSIAAARLAAAETARGYREVVEAHRNLAEDRDAAGLQTVGWGDFSECPPVQAEASDKKSNPLRVVESA